MEACAVTAALSAKMQALIQVLTVAGNGTPTTAARVSAAAGTGAVAMLPR